MSTKVSAIPEGYSSVTIYLTIRNAAEAIEFYKKAFNAKEIGRLTMGGNVIGHAELQIGNARIMLSDEMPDWGTTSPQTLNGTAAGICIYTEDVDALFRQAVDAGATVLPNGEVKDQFYGDRSGTVLDPYGHKWTIATHIEDVTFEEMQRRSDAMFAPQNA